MKPGSDEWFRAEALELDHVLMEHIGTPEEYVGAIESALRRVWNESVREVLMHQPLTHDPYTHAWAIQIRAKKVST